MTEQCSKHVLQADAPSNALYGRTDGRTNGEGLSPTRDSQTSVTRAPAYEISPIRSAIRRRNLTGKIVHGTQSGYRSRGCRCQRCKDAVTRAGNLYKLSRMEIGPHEVDATGTRRRILALGVNAWTQREIARESGITQRTVGRIATGRVSSVHVDTARAVRAAFNRLELRRGTGTLKTTRAALAAGGQPPLAWDDDSIDNPFATPDLVGIEDDTDVDPVAVARAIDGSPVTLTDAERREVFRRLAAEGVTNEEIGRRIGMTERTIGRWRAAIIVERMAS